MRAVAVMQMIYGTLENDIQWELDWRTGILDLKGEGPIPNFYPFLGDFPGWSPLREQVREVRVGQGITRIGTYAFYPHGYGAYANMRAPLCRVIFPPSLESIGRSGFRANAGLPFIDLRGLANLRSIGEYAFACCFGAKAADLGGCMRLEELDPRAFWGCDGLSYINLEGCVSLTDENLQALRKETPPHVPIIMPSGSVSCDGSSLRGRDGGCRAFLGSPQEFAPA